ncbi:hypothetical protein [Ornithinibacillus bavariensis]|uniref:Lipoprotein n=1 Tax=Ornithinibacillus bavariensis TaxID=545502 RepID=A0A919X6F8_9BACI|nr:hypothetical protein [Ornithinibacillus bavariensis]GIO25733.1 hypothetical protein J43TS3_03440 [Ornithinibacillus bavariensis]
MKKKIILLFSVLLILVGCGREAEEEQQVEQVTTYAKFQSLDIQIDKNQIIITGEADASDNKFYYSVVQAEKEIGREKEVRVDKTWGKFIIEIPIMKEMINLDEVVIVNLYTRSSEGEIINPNYVPIDLQLEMSEESE